MQQGHSQNPLLAGWLVFTTGFLLRFLPLVLHRAVAQGDEIFQGPEAGHRLVFGYGLVPWEFAYGARSWILGLLSAGPMEIAKWLNAGPAFYLPLIAALFAALGALTSLCIFVRAERFYGTAGAAAAAIASACWIDNIYFGARTLGEPLAAHLLILAVLLAGPGTVKRRNLMLGGFLAAAAFVVRMQIAPAIALLWLWPGVTRRRFAFLTLGAAVALAADALLDIMTWGVPFKPLWMNFRFNFLLHGAAHFGVAPPSEYLRFLAYNWGASGALLLALALLGARRMPMFLAMAVAVIAVHMLVGHKEYRFIFPAIAMLSVLAGFGLVELTRILAHGVGADRSIAAPAWLAVLVGIVWAAVSLLNVIGRGYEQNWRRSHDILAAELQLSHTPTLCGVGFSAPLSWTGGYTFLHRRVPIYSFADSPNTVGITGAANAVVAERTFADAASSPYRKQKCFQDYCIFTRSGACKAIPLPPPQTGPLSISAAEADSYLEGITPP